MPKLVLMRHGESQWNLENRFTGWTDVDLTDVGREEARQAGQLLKQAGITFDVAFTSVLKRAIRSLWIVLDVLDRMYTPIHNSWRLNERHYGTLQGLNKQETAQAFGNDQVLQWRRAYDVAPTALLWEDARHPRFDPRYAHIPPEQLPATECLKDTVARVLPFWHGAIVPALRSGNVLVVAHNNSLRALIKYLDDISDQEIVSLNLPTGKPLVYEFDAAEFNQAPHALRRDYLGDPNEIAVAIAAVAAQGQVKQV